MKTVLLVEDNPAHVLLIKNALMEFNHKIHVVPVETGRQALDCISGGIPDLIILDLNMPEMNGFEFLEAKKELLFPARCVPVIVLTTSPLRQDVIESYRLGAAAYIVKPSEYKEIKAMAASLLGFYNRTELPTGG